MIRVLPADEPERFDDDCRRPGNEWLAANPSASSPKPLWRAFTHDLAQAFEHRCGYSAVRIQSGDVDHFQSWKHHRALAYEWGNYRYVDGRLNSKKQAADDAVLDPFEVEDDWFEILLPSLQLRATDRVPDHLRTRAAFTLQRLGLDHDERIVAYRAQWYCMYHCGKLSLDGLGDVAPQIARAVRKADLAPDAALCGHGALARSGRPIPPSPPAAPSTAPAT